MASGLEQSHIGKMVGARIREARKALKLTQSQLAAGDFSVSYISAIERGQIHPSLRAMEIIAQRLGLSSKDLLLASPSTVKDARESRGKSDEDGGSWSALVAHILTLQGAGTQAIQVVGERTTKYAGLAQRIYALYVLALAHASIGQWQESDHALLEAERLVKDATSSLALRILDVRGIVQAHTDTHAQGLELLQQCRDLLEAQLPPDVFFKAKVCAQMGYWMLQAESIEEACDLFATALQQTQAITPAEQAALNYELFRQNDREDILAELAAYKSLNASSQISMQARYRELHHMLGHTLLRSDRNQALIYLTAALEEEPRDPFVQASAHTHLALWEMAEQNMAEAREHAKRAFALLQAEGDSITAADAHFALGDVEYAQKRYKAGDSYFKDGLAMLERLGEGEDLHERCAQYATLLEKKGDAHQAAYYWKKAYESRRKLKR